MIRTCWKMEPGEPLTVAVNLVQKIVELYCSSIV